jgi:hypothetical protein
MPSPSKKSYGPIVQARARSLLQVLLEAIATEQTAVQNLEWKWSDEEPQAPKLIIETTLQAMVLLCHPELQTNTEEFRQAKRQVREALANLRNFVEILKEQRVKTRGSARWHFTLHLWSKQVDRNLAAFDKLWDSKRSPRSKFVPEPSPQSGLKPEAPCPRVRLPDNFVPRLGPIAAVKNLLLAEGGTVVVSAIAGLGGLGRWIG